MTSHDLGVHDSIREEVRKLCAHFPGEYWRKLDEARAYPTAFVQALRASLIEVVEVKLLVLVAPSWLLRLVSPHGSHASLRGRRWATA